MGKTASMDRRASAPVVLIVDDDPEWRDFLCTILGDKHFLLVAADGNAALEIAARMRPDAIILDVFMSPGKDGFSTLHTLRSRAETAHTAIIMLTAINDVSQTDFDKEVVGRYLGAEPTVYLNKPVEPAVLLSTLRSVLSVAGQTQEVGPCD